MASHLVSAQLLCRIFRSDAAVALHLARYFYEMVALKIRYRGFSWLDSRVAI
jgi:hypothetical protein